MNSDGVKRDFTSMLHASKIIEKQVFGLWAGPVNIFEADVSGSIMFGDYEYSLTTGETN